MPLYRRNLNAKQRRNRRKKIASQTTSAVFRAMKRTFGDDSRLAAPPHDLQEK